MNNTLSLTEKIDQAIREVPDFPIPGILFKDITPILQNPKLCKEITLAFCERIAPLQPQVISAVESRGFFFGPLMAQELMIPFVPFRKKGKLPGKTIAHEYKLEYGTATIEVHSDQILPGQRVIVHDDLLATGGTAGASAELVAQCGGEVVGFAFLVDLSFLNGREKLASFGVPIIDLIRYLYCLFEPEHLTKCQK